METAVYWFGNWHQDPRQEQIMGKGWTEWQLVKAAQPRFPGHKQPVKPLWGYSDDCDPQYFQKSTNLAANMGISAFIVDWYWFKGPFLERPLQEVIQKANTPVKFALMWANQDWPGVFPADYGKPISSLLSAKVNSAEFSKLTDYVINAYFKNPRYWRINGAAYFSLFLLDDLCEWLGGVAETKKALDNFRERARNQGAGELHIASVSTNYKLHGLGSSSLDYLGIDSVTQYNWFSMLPQKQIINYAEWASFAVKEWDLSRTQYPVRVQPNVSVGWDSTPRTPQDGIIRCEQWPFLGVVVDNTPEKVAEILSQAYDWAKTVNRGDYITINAWNEWTEGAFIEPTETDGYELSNALGKVIQSWNSRR